MVASIPIKSIDEIELIKDLYRKKNQLQELLMFTLAINTGLGLLELLNLKVKDVKGKHYLSIGKQKSIPLNSEIIHLVEEFAENKKTSELLFQNSRGSKLGRTAVFYDFKDISYLMWLFNQHSVNIAFKFIDVEENMNLRFREGVCL